MSRRKLAGLRILVTELRRALAVRWWWRLPGAGSKVLAAARSQPLLDELAADVRQANGIIETVKADVTKPEDRQAMVDAAVRHFGGLDVLINNAGIGATGHFIDSDPEILRQIFETNFFGADGDHPCVPAAAEVGRHTCDCEHLICRWQAGTSGAIAVFIEQVRSRWVQRGHPCGTGQGWD